MPEHPAKNSAMKRTAINPVMRRMIRFTPTQRIKSRQLNPISQRRKGRRQT
jgi:hypothetical protein